ncbi:trypsin-like peptidase domain-containing protein [Clostridium cellulovorans]|uniref:Peptidase S1 and S6 chymotrypsin/Hap n=1 Tax=Clostridium cellulovorans (strain ATCC 35296 / DSM 3052 / OCM 3 / 743B) TaxID=573061 RepID=D9SPZ9_CLOC7|nr:trypsin-like peptidase domain-containing protein [Clostridium cellulovorans]ADL52135.1 peptidase S1 and S6 chymotrypsin/Hap [Clostridium cellulovorans 743B]
MNEKIIGRVTCNEDLLGTCFLVTPSYVLTAYHVIKNKNNVKIEFQVIGETRKVESIFFYNEKDIDLAIIKLNKDIKKAIEYCDIDTIIAVEQGDFWETSGYPDEYENDERLYVNGTINRYIEDQLPDLELSINDQKEVSEWQGISGSPLIVNDQICGIVLKERTSSLKTKLKAISMEKIIGFLCNETEVLKILSYRRKNLLSERIETFNKECNDIFFSYKYVGEDFISNCLILKPESEINDLVYIIDLFLKDYANSMQEIINEQNNNMINRRKQEKRNEYAAEELKRILIKSNKLGFALLWIILEGVFQAPRVATAYSMENEIKQDIYISRSADSIKVSIGYTEMKKDLMQSILKVLIEIDKEIGTNEQKIFIWDELAINYLDIYNRLHVEELQKKEQSGEKVNLEIVILHSYDSNIYKKNIYKKSNNTNKIAENFCKAELDQYNKKIVEICSKFKWIKSKQIMWISLPCESLELFHNIIQHGAED